MDDQELAEPLVQINASGRDVLRRAMRAEQFERDELARRLMEDGSPVARDLADLVDLASLHLEVRQQLARVLGYLEVVD